jgi:hypothetical protein
LKAEENMNKEYEQIINTIQQDYRTLTADQIKSFHNLSLKEFSNIYREIEKASKTQYNERWRGKTFVIVFPKDKDGNNDKNREFQNVLMTFIQKVNVDISEFVKKELDEEGFLELLSSLSASEEEESSEELLANFHTSEINTQLILSTIADKSGSREAEKLHLNKTIIGSFAKLLQLTLSQISLKKLSKAKGHPALLQYLNIPNEDWKMMAQMNIEIKMLEKLSTWGLDDSQEKYDIERSAILTRISNDINGWVINEIKGKLRYLINNHDASNGVFKPLTDYIESEEEQPLEEMKVETKRLILELEEASKKEGKKYFNKKGHLTTYSKNNIIFPLWKHLGKNPDQLEYFTPYIKLFDDHNSLSFSALWDAAKMGTTLSTYDSEGNELDQSENYVDPNATGLEEQTDSENQIEYIYNKVSAAFPKEIVNLFISNYQPEMKPSKESLTKFLETSEDFHKYVYTTEKGIVLSQYGYSAIKTHLLKKDRIPSKKSVTLYKPPTKTSPYSTTTNTRP